jgi:hypothetical protein
MRDWLVPPVLFPIFLILLIAGCAIPAHADVTAARRGR